MKRSFLYSFGISKSTFSSNFIPIVVILVLSIVTITPKLYFGAAAYVMILWIAFFFFEYNKIIRSNKKLKNLLTLGIIYVLVCITYKLLGISSASIEYCTARPFLYFAPVLALMIMDKCYNNQQLRFMFHILALIIAINIADNIRLSLEYGIENIVYQNLAGQLREEGNQNLNLGGSMFVNMIVFYSCAMFFAFLNSTKLIERLLFFIYFVISAYFILFCSLKASAVILMLISFVFMYVSYRSNENTGVILTLTAIVGGLVFLFSDYIVGFLIDIIASDRISQRLTSFTTGGSVEDSSLTGRANLWQVSVHSWLSSVSSFFFGIGDHNWNDFITTEDSGIGAHSDLLDVLGRYGILGALILYSSIKIYYSYLQKKYGYIFKWEIISFFILFLLMGLTKKFIAPQPSIVIFIMFPLTIKYISIINEKNYG